MRVRDLTDGQDLCDAIEKHRKDIELLQAAYIRQQEEIKNLKRMIYDLQDGRISLP